MAVTYSITVNYDIYTEEFNDFIQRLISWAPEMAEDDPPLVDPVLKDFKFPERVERVFGIRKIDFNLPNPIALANWIWLMQQLLVYLVQRWLNMNKKTPISQQEMDDAVAYSLQQ